MQTKGIPKSKILKELRNAYNENFHFKKGRVLGSMCSSPHEISKYAHFKFIESNLGNPGLYPGTKKLEGEVIKILAELLHGKNISGHIVSGGTEANITALWIAKKLTRKKEVIIPRSAHFSFLKATDLMNLKHVCIELNENYQIDLNMVRKKISDETVAIVGVAGTTELGVIDPIEELSEICNGKIFLHVDAAFGGFVIPFLKDLGYKMPKYDFELNGVSSMTIDPHKMGMATIPSGALLVREEKFLHNISVETPYLTTVRQTCLAGTRCSGAVASAYAVMKHLGREGYKKIVKQCMENTFYLQKRVEEIGLSLVIKPVMNIIGINLKKPMKVYEELMKMNWRVSLAKTPECLRIVIMPHVNKKVIDNFIPDLEKVCKKLGEI